jgi:hypothetical protein
MHALIENIDIIIGKKDNLDLHLDSWKGEHKVNAYHSLLHAQLVAIDI